MTDTQMSLPELEQARAELDRKISAARLAAKADAINRVLALMDELGVTQRMLGTRSQAARKPSGQRHTSAGKKVAVKYRGSHAGETWSGRGLQPKWLRDAIAAGASLASFQVEASKPYTED